MLTDSVNMEHMKNANDNFTQIKTKIVNSQRDHPGCK